MKTVIIGLSGYKLSGKDTFAGFLVEGNPKAIILRFADPLKEELANACGVTVDEINKNKSLYRVALQWWGTEFRRGQDKEYWLKKMQEKIDQFKSRGFELIVISDVRFINEAQLITNQGGHIFRIDRTEHEPDSHASETEMLHYNAFAGTIYNHGSLALLRETAQLFLSRFLKLK